MSIFLQTGDHNLNYPCVPKWKVNVIKLIDIILIINCRRKKKADRWSNISTRLEWMLIYYGASLEGHPEKKLLWSSQANVTAFSYQGLETSLGIIWNVNGFITSFPRRIYYYGLSLSFLPRSYFHILIHFP